MSDAWFYRDGPAAPERGPVTASDLDYLRSTGRLTPGMEIRRQYGDWQPASSKSADCVHWDEIPVSSPSSSPVEASAAPSNTTQPTSPPAVPVLPPPIRTRAQQERPWLVPSIVGVCAVLLLLILLLTLNTKKGDGSGLASSGVGNASKDGDGKAESDGAGDTEAQGRTGEESPKSKSLASSTANDPPKEEARRDADTGQRGPGGTGLAQTADDDQPEVDIAPNKSPAPKAKTYFISSGAEFFGIRSSGSRFVFLIDGSSSMQGSRDSAARKELIESVRRMDVDMELEVIFFTDVLSPVFGKYRKLDDVDDVVSAIQTTRPLMGGTPVMEGVRRALGMKPDAVFLLTDGSFNEGDVTAAVSVLNKNKIPINTIGFHFRGSENVLRSLAKTSGGDYRYVAP